MSDADAAAHAPSRRPDGQQRLRNYWLLIRADRPIGIYLLLWPALWALWIAGAGEPTWWVVLIFVLGTALMRSAGCAINDYADREFDGLVERTKGRPLVNGLVTPGEALGVFVVLSLAAFGLVLLLNSKTVAHSFVAVGLAALYPFTKRITPLPQLFLGLAFGWAVPMAFTALQNAIPPVAWVLLLATVTWAVIYDTMYAMVDRDDDVRIDELVSMLNPFWCFGPSEAYLPDLRQFYFKNRSLPFFTFNGNFSPVLPDNIITGR